MARGPQLESKRFRDDDAARTPMGVVSPDSVIDRRTVRIRRSKPMFAHWRPRASPRRQPERDTRLLLERHCGSSVIRSGSVPSLERATSLKVL